MNKLGEDDEIAFVVRSDIDEVLDRAQELVVILHRARLELAGCDAHRLDPARQALLHRLVAVDVGVTPDHHHGIAVGSLILRKVILHDAIRLKAIGKLEANDRIVDLPCEHLVEIILRALGAIGLAPTRA